MMGVGIAIMGFLVTYVVPQVATIFKESHTALPLATQLLIGLSDILIGYWYLILGGLAGMLGRHRIWAVDQKAGAVFTIPWCSSCPTSARP